MDQIVEAALPKIRQSIERAIREHRVPGAAIGIVRDQELVWTSGAGYADLSSKRPIDEHTRFGVASITKTFTAAAVVQLRDEGKLSLDDPLVRHIPEFKAVAVRHGRLEDITLRRLASHAAGLVGEAPGGHWSSAVFPTMEQILSGIGSYAIVINPDSAFKYSNLAFALLGEVVSRVSGRSFTDYIQENLLQPLGMNESCFTLAEAGNAMATGYLPHPYEDVPDKAVTAAEHRGYAAAAGLRSSVADLAKWISLQFRTKAETRGGAQVLAGKSIREMHRAQHVEPDWKAGYCIGWMAARLGDDIFLNHGGSNPGYLSMVAFDSRNRTGVIVLTNCQGHPAMGTIAFEALTAMAEKSRESGAGRPAPEATPTPERLRPLLGRYEHVNYGIAMNVEFRGGELMLVIPPSPGWPPPPPPSKLSAGARANVFIVESGRPAGEPIEFQFDRDGRVTGFILGENGDFITRVSR